jgi:hypothetical protein
MRLHAAWNIRYQHCSLAQTKEQSINSTYQECQVVQCHQISTYQHCRLSTGCQQSTAVSSATSTVDHYYNKKWYTKWKKEKRTKKKRTPTVVERLCASSHCQQAFQRHQWIRLLIATVLLIVDARQAGASAATKMALLQRMTFYYFHKHFCKYCVYVFGVCN